MKLAPRTSQLESRKWKRYIICVDDDHALLDALPAGTDPCGENGEFHSFVSAGPMLSRKIAVEVGKTVERDGFAYADLLPV